MRGDDFEIERLKLFARAASLAAWSIRPLRFGKPVTNEMFSATLSVSMRP